MWCKFLRLYRISRRGKYRALRKLWFFQEECSLFSSHLFLVKEMRMLGTEEQGMKTSAIEMFPNMLNFFVLIDILRKNYTELKCYCRFCNKVKKMILRFTFIVLYFYKIVQTFPPLPPPQHPTST